MWLSWQTWISSSKAPAARTALSSSLSDRLRLAAHALLSPLGQHLLARSRLPCAFEWLEVVPTFPDAQLTDEQYCVALALWLGEPVPALAGVGARDLLGRATLTSPLGPVRFARHNFVNRTLMDMAIEAGAVSVTPEQQGLFRSLAAREAASAAAAAVAKVEGYRHQGHRLLHEQSRHPGGVPGLLAEPAARLLGRGH